MGFYGDIKNLDKIPFQFDRIFSNRTEMDAAAAAGTDGIFSGRFVLIKYNNDGNYILSNNNSVVKDADYSQNYNIDRDTYGEDFDLRGYDATIWQKVYNEGKGQFISIAHLNGIMPTITLEAIAPTQLPAEVHFDGSSTYGYYKIDVPAHWGFKIKEAASEDLSDQQITQTVLNYTNGVEYETNEQINADIYLNLKNTNKSYKYTNLPYSTNEIKLTPSGKSGKLYNGIAENDYYELGIHLPAIGNMVSDGYDLIYGDNNDEDANGRVTRPTDITFYPGNESESMKYNGNPLLGGKTYNLNTLAGSLNTIHNRLGQIIVPLDDNSYDIATLSEDVIYKRNGKYWRKGKIYTQEPVDDLYEYEQATVTSLNFQVNKYYYKSGSRYLPATEYDSRKTYYLKKITGIRYTNIDLIPFVSGQYYLKENDAYYKCDNSSDLPFDENRTYYTINAGNPVSTLRAAYEPDGSFYVKEGNNYISYAELSPDMSLTFYKIQNTTNLGSQRYYAKDAYYYRDLTNQNTYYLDNNINPTTGREYFMIKFDLTNPTYGLVNGQISLYYPMIGEPIPVGQLLRPDDIENYYFKEGNNYISYKVLANMSATEDGFSPYTVQRTYYKINQISEPLTAENIFLPNVYWEKNNDNDYLKAQEWDPLNNYYNITATVLNTKFYIPNKYYYKIDENLDDFELDELSTMTHNQYYTKTRLFVLRDSYGNCPYGYEWNDFAAYIPPSIELYTQGEAYDLIELEGFGGDGNNTINGNLLALNKFCDLGNEVTRDTRTLSGALNSVKDQLYTIKTLHPNRILTVNDFGQITTTDYTLQNLQAVEQVQQLTEDFEQYAEMADRVNYLEELNTNIKENNLGGRTANLSNSEYVAEILNVAKSYYNAAKNYTYGQDHEPIFYYYQGNKDTDEQAHTYLNTEYDPWDDEYVGKAYRNIDCSTYIGLILRGLSFEDTYKKVWYNKSIPIGEVYTEADIDEDNIESEENNSNSSNSDNEGTTRYIAKNSKYDWSLDLGHFTNEVELNAERPTLIRTASQIGEFMDKSGMAVNFDESLASIEPGDIVFWAKKKTDGNFKQPDRYKKISHIAICSSKTNPPTSKITITNKNNISTISYDADETYKALLKLISNNLEENSNYVNKDYRQYFKLIGRKTTVTEPGGNEHDEWIYYLSRRVKHKEAESKYSLGENDYILESTSLASNFEKPNFQNNTLSQLNGKYTSIKEDNEPHNTVAYLYTKELNLNLLDGLSGLGIELTIADENLDEVSCCFNYYPWDTKYPYKHGFYHVTNIAPYVCNATLEKNSPEDIVLVCRPPLGVQSPNSSALNLSTDLGIFNINEVFNPGIYYLVQNITGGLPDGITKGSYHTLKVERTIRKNGKVYALTQTLWNNININGFWKRVQYCYSSEPTIDGQCFASTTFQFLNTNKVSLNKTRFNMDENEDFRNAVENLTGTAKKYNIYLTGNTNGNYGHILTWLAKDENDISCNFLSNALNSEQYNCFDGLNVTNFGELTPSSLTPVFQIIIKPAWSSWKYYQNSEEINNYLTTMQTQITNAVSSTIQTNLNENLNSQVEKAFSESLTQDTSESQNINDISKPGLYHMTNYMAIDNFPDSIETESRYRYALKVERVMTSDNKIKLLVQTLWETFYNLRASNNSTVQLKKKGFWRRVQYCYSSEGGNGMIIDGEFNPNNWSPWEYYPSQSELENQLEDMATSASLEAIVSTIENKVDSAVIIGQNGSSLISTIDNEIVNGINDNNSPIRAALVALINSIVNPE